MATIPIRVNRATYAKAQELMAATPDKRFAPGESKGVSDRQLTDMAYGWLIGRLEGDVFSKAEVRQTVLKTVVDVLGEALGQQVNGVLAGDSILLSYDLDGVRREVTINVGAN